MASAENNSVETGLPVGPVTTFATPVLASGNILADDGVSTYIQTYCGTDRQPKSILYDMIPTDKPIDREVLRSQIVILGQTTVSEKELDDTVSDLTNIKKAVDRCTASSICQVMIARAQFEGITYQKKLISRFDDLRDWWASLSKDQALEKGEMMFRIVQQPFDDNKWSKELETKVMKAANLVYYVPPLKQVAGTKGCIEKIAVQKRINESKRLFKKCKSIDSHCLYISVKPKDNVGVSSVAHRKDGVFLAWMLQEYVPKATKAKTGRAARASNVVCGEAESRH